MRVLLLLTFVAATTSVVAPIADDTTTVVATTSVVAAMADVTTSIVVLLKLFLI